MLIFRAKKVRTQRDLILISFDVALIVIKKLIDHLRLGVGG